MKTIRLSMASLDAPVFDPQNRYVEPMSTLIASDLWLIETQWDGASISDVVVFINKRCNPGTSIRETNHETGEPYPHEWAYWNSVPAGKIKCYKVLDADRPVTQTWKTNAEPQAKAGKSPSASA